MGLSSRIHHCTHPTAVPADRGAFGITASAQKPEVQQGRETSPRLQPGLPRSLHRTDMLCHTLPATFASRPCLLTLSDPCSLHVPVTQGAISQRSPMNLHNLLDPELWLADSCTNHCTASTLSSLSSPPRSQRKPCQRCSRGRACSGALTAALTVTLAVAMRPAASLAGAPTPCWSRAVAIQRTLREWWARQAAWKAAWQAVNSPVMVAHVVCWWILSHSHGCLAVGLLPSPAQHHEQWAPLAAPCLHPVPLPHGA